MHTLINILRYVLAAMVVLLLGSLAGWYFYVRSQENPLAPEKVEVVGTAGGFEGNRGLPPENVSAGEMQGASSTEPARGRDERLWRVDQGPIAGFSFVRSRSGTASSSPPAVFFAERANGYIFSADLQLQAVERITNTLMPKTYEAHFATSGGYVWLRSLDESGNITTYAGTFLLGDATTTPQSLSGAYMPTNIRKIFLDNGGRRIFMVSNDPASGGSIVTSQLFDGTASKKVFSSFIRSWRPLFAQGQLMMLTDPADDLPGYAYKVGDTGRLIPLVDSLPGLTVAPHPTESALLYSGSGNGQIALFLQVGKAAATELPLQTIADKCVWAPDLSAQSAGTNRSPVRAPGKTLIAYCAVPSTLPSSAFMQEWYQGVLHTEDVWWRIDAASGTTELLFTPSVALDVHDPTIDASGRYIAFTNGTDQSLWVLKIMQ